MSFSRLVYVVIYHEAPDYVEPLGVHHSMEAAKERGNQHFASHHTGGPLWRDDEHGAKASHKNAYYLVRGLELVEH